MKIIHPVLGLFVGFALIIILLFTGIQTVVYWIPGYFSHEYQKYQVSETVGISLPDLLEVTEEMMDYLDGGRDTLHDIETTIQGKEHTPFFNSREIAHMEDVKALFIGALRLRMFLIGFIVLAVLIFIFTHPNAIQFLARSILHSILIFLTAFALLLLLIFRDFSSAFITFHHIFFTNDLWILDPSDSNLINIVPEGFFFDTARNIGIMFIAFLLLTALLCILGIRKSAENKQVMKKG